VNGNSINIGTSASSSFSAIDTGTTLIGGPSAVIKEIFSAIPGSQPATGDYQGYYTYPCSSAVQVTLAFGGGTSWSIDPEDFTLSQLETPDLCLGAFFSLDMGPNGPTWIIGDTFLAS
jgi:cathepsin D